MKQFRVEFAFGNQSGYRIVEANNNLEAIIKTCNFFKAKKSKKEYWPMRAIEL